MPPVAPTTRRVLTSDAPAVLSEMPAPSDRGGGYHNGRADAILRLLRGDSGLTSAEVHERLKLGGSYSTTSALLTRLKQRGLVRNHNYRWHLGAAAPAGATGPTAVLALLERHPEGAYLDQLRPDGLCRETVRTYLRALVRQNVAHAYNGRWFPGPEPAPTSPGLSGEPSPSVEPQPGGGRGASDTPPAGDTAQRPALVAAAAVHDLLTLSGVPPHPDALVRMAWALGELTALRGTR